MQAKGLFTKQDLPGSQDLARIGGSYDAVTHDLFNPSFSSASCFQHCKKAGALLPYLLLFVYHQSTGLTSNVYGVVSHRCACRPLKLGIVALVSARISRSRY